jgi:hypothetical protein
MTMKYVRDTYGVPAKRGMLVEVYYQRRPWGEGAAVGDWLLAKRGRITSASSHIHVEGVPYHPTDNVVYYGDDGEVLMDTRETSK